MKTGAVYGRCYLQSRPFTTTAHYSDDGSKPQRLCMLASFASLSFSLGVILDTYFEVEEEEEIEMK